MDAHRRTTQLPQEIFTAGSLTLRGLHSLRPSWQPVKRRGGILLPEDPQVVMADIRRKANRGLRVRVRARGNT